MSESLLLEMATAIIAREPVINGGIIRDKLQQAAMLPMISVSESDIERLAQIIESRYQVSMAEGAVLVDRDHKPWLPSQKASIHWFYWNRYRSYLNQTGLPATVVNRLDDVTDRVLGLIENPLRTDSWDRRGLVLGHVQSGKTSNYIGLINKAADAGYKLIVVIAGVQDKLRNQTQSRVDEGFIGRDSSLVLRKEKSRFIGVGKLGEERFPVPFTNSVSDFKKVIASSVGVSLSNLNEPAVFVIKKNPTTLKNIIEWLRAHSSLGANQQIDEPFLLIDDEADNASINTSRDPQAATRINKQIRELLSIFTRSAYVGYTATPFANIFINPDAKDKEVGEDLFPRDFIVSLDPPSNYFGPHVIFDGSEQSLYLRYIEDAEGVLPAVQRRGFSVDELPESLHEAVRAFVLAKAIRILRGDGHHHCSMLVNASASTRVHGELKNKLHDFLVDIQNQLSHWGGLTPRQAEKFPAIAALQQTWEKEYQHLEFEWDQVFGVLRDAALPVSVVEINSKSKDALPYQEYAESGLSVIVVGGIALSRGLTLEGLVVSYFNRSSKMYDTLMQMGRWFGYRPNYKDLCRIWMPEETVGWFEHVADATEQLRDEIMTMESLRARPKDFGLKVQAHPDALMVTARNKLGTSQQIPVSLSLGRTFIETAELRWDSKSRLHNLDKVRLLVESLQEHGFTIPKADVRGNRVLTGVPVKHVLDFIRSWESLPTYYKTDPELITKYVEGRGDFLARWDVAFMGLADPSRGIVDDSLGFTVIRQNRSAGEGFPRDGALRITDKQRIASPADERIGIDPKLATSAEDKYRAKLDKFSGTVPGHVYRKIRERPLLLVHLLSITKKKSGALISDEGTAAWSISFPGAGDEDTRVDYVVNSIWLREYFGDTNADDDDEEFSE